MSIRIPHNYEPSIACALVMICACGSHGCQDLQASAGTANHFTAVAAASVDAAHYEAVIGGNAQRCQAVAKGWKTVPSSTLSVPSIVAVGLTGSFTMQVVIDAALLGGQDQFGPVAIGVSDSSLTYTLLALVPLEYVFTNATVAITLDPVSTATALMLCPSGEYPSGDAGKYCLSDAGRLDVRAPVQTAIIDSLAHGNSNLVPNTLDWAGWVKSLLEDQSVLDVLNQVLATHNLAATTADDVSKLISDHALALIDPQHPAGTEGQSCAVTACESGEFCASRRECSRDHVAGTCTCNQESSEGVCTDRTAVGNCESGGESCKEQVACCPGLSCVDGACSMGCGAF